MHQKLYPPETLVFRERELTRGCICIKQIYTPETLVLRERENLTMDAYATRPETPVHQIKYILPKH